MRRIWQIEYMTRPDEREHIEQFDDFREAHRKAREMSDKHDCDSVVMALDPMPDGYGQVVTGHMEYRFGMRGEREGSCAKMDWPQ